MAILSQPVPDSARRPAPTCPTPWPTWSTACWKRTARQRIPSVRLVGAELEAISEGSRSEHGSAQVTGWQVERASSSQPSISESRFATPRPLPRARATTLPTTSPSSPRPLWGAKPSWSSWTGCLSDPDVRLVTVLAWAGMGKTRLALEAAARQLDRYPDGVYFVSLAPLRSAEAIVPAVAQALGFTFYGAAVAPRQQLLDYLRQKSILLLLTTMSTC